jgi:membrane associated rhomboid family serine protease
LVPTYNKHKDDYGYRSLGASGAVSAVVFASIFLDPTNEIGFFIIPPIIPGFIFAPVYLFISAYMSKKGADNINHSAHIWGALYGIAFLIVTALVLSGFNPITHFVNEISGYLQ